MKWSDIASMILAPSCTISVLGFFHFKKYKQFTEDAQITQRLPARYFEPSVSTKQEGFLWKV